ncbi:uncharacterized protein LOC126845938 isoform X4 [Adelges cooleyi]|uniref:uncharacterized protein LOC126845938 isoform X4 n=1 Tax=Adelges cooleyi TaxID=133065 RepID=UPI00217F3CDC|nr:uncharacterized protein LOC126845938 isoform X4 [Adelges cooleyi]
MAGQSTVVLAMIIAALAVQSTYSMKSAGGFDGVCARRLDSMVGQTESTTNGIPFSWGPEYEVAVVYVTSKWAELNISNKTALMAASKSAFLTFCVHNKNILNNFMVQVNGNQNESQEVKDDVLAWYNYAVGKYVDNDNSLPKEGDADYTPAFYITKFQNSYYHFINRAKVTFDKTNLDDTKQEMDDMSKNMMDMLLETIRNLTQQLRQLQNNQKSNDIIASEL